MNQALFEIILKISDSKSDNISANTPLEELGWDSLSNLAFISEIDAKFGKSLSIDQLVNAKSVADLIDTVEL